MQNFSPQTVSVRADQIIRQLKAGLPVESFDDLRKYLDPIDNSLAQIVFKSQNAPSANAE